MAEGGGAPAAGVAPFASPEDSEPALAAAGLQRLLTWMSPAFPVGGFSYSHGLEWAVEEGTIHDAATLRTWIEGVLVHGAGRSDAIFFAEARRAADAADEARLAAIAELAAAFQPTKERALESTAQGRAFLAAVSAGWPSPKLARFAALFPIDRPVAYPVAVAIASAAEDVPLRPALTAFLTGFAANLVSAGVRAIPVGQSDGLRVVAALAPLIGEIGGAALASTLDDIGGIAFRADIASMKHETQYTRLFRS